MSMVALAPTAPPAAPPSASQSFVSIERVSKRFAVRRTWAEILAAPFRRTYAQALTDVTFGVAEGEFFGLLGPNGAGKTTLFKILATLVIPDTGRTAIDGHDVVADVRHVRKLLVPVVADERSLRWRLNAYENMRLYAALYRVPRAETKRRIEELLDVVNLTDTGQRQVGQFSSGMKQRLLVARALLGRPRVLLLDEPTRGLDPLSARSLRAFLKDEICRRQGCTVVLATHNAEEAFHLCDRVAILDKGRVLTTGPASRLVDEFAEERYRVWTRVDAPAVLDRLVRRGLVLDVGPRRPDADGWSTVDLRVPGGHAGTARVVEALMAERMEIARFERVQPTLAELIERVQERSRNGDVNPGSDEELQDA
jgi:ABC-2 type transport system ATP-binding protein